MDQLKELFAKYLDNCCTTREISLLMQHFGKSNDGPELRDAIATELEKEMEDEDHDDLLDARILKIYDQLRKNIDPVRSATFSYPVRIYIKYITAAAVLLVVSFGMYFYIRPDRAINSRLTTTQHLKDDVSPGGNKAILTLADGSEVSLTNATNGKLASQSGITIIKTRDGELVYSVGNNAAISGPEQYNSISTPIGGQYQVNLPDGTKVWLNSMSTLKYPTMFNGSVRRVVFAGEAYFEVAKNPNKPFVVTSDVGGRTQNVTVLGTHFNINSYPDEIVTRTTLLEGSVKVTSGSESKILKPGQESVLSNSLIVKEADAEQALDWKNDNFYFYDENIRSIMRKLARWYDMEVVYQGKMPEYGFDAEISRTKKLSEILSGFETTGRIHFKIEGRRVTVME